MRVGDMVFVSGTTASDEAGATQHPGTRIFVRNIEDSEVVARAHGSIFADIRPANTLLRGEPIDSEMLVEVEVDAVLSPGQ